MTTSPDLEQLARGLSHAMREAIAHPENGVYFWTADFRTEKAIDRRGLLGPRHITGTRAWTPLGLALRDHLRKQS